MIVLRMAKEARAHFLVRAGEWFMAGETALIGLSLAVHGRTFETSRVYSLMARMGEERTWAWMALTIAALRVAALFVNGTMPNFARWSPMARGLISIVSGMIWLAVGGCIYWENPLSIFPFPIAGLGLADFVLSAIIADEAGVVEKRARDANR